MSVFGLVSAPLWFPPLLFGCDLGITLAAAWLLVCGSGHARHGALESILAWLWTALALVAAAGVMLGVAGGFGPLGFGVVHAGMLGAALAWRWPHLRADGAALASLGGRVEVALGAKRTPRVVALALGVIMGLQLLLAVFAEPAVMDALNYHLPRLGHWLQEGRIRMIGAGDERLDYISGLVEVVMAWLLGPVREGFRGVVISQTVGGALAIGATIGLARLSGLGRTAALLAGGMLLGMGNVAAQMTAAQTDLFTAGVFATAFYLWAIALKRGETSLLGALGAGLALGAKATVFYLAPAALLWMAWLVRQAPLNRDQWRRALLAGIVGVGIFAGPGLWRNWQTYGDVRGPAHWIREFHPEGLSWGAMGEKLKLNTISALAQNFDPHSQPSGTPDLARRAGKALVAGLPATDPYTFLGQSRRDGLNRGLQRSSPDADMTSFGLPVLLLFVGGSVLALVRVRQPAARLVLVWSFGVWLFFLTFNVLHQWHPFSFRYYVLVAPWVAIVAAWGVEQIKGAWRNVVWAIIVLCTLDIGWRITFQTHQGGWQSVSHPERTIGYHIARGWREWSQQLDQPDGGLRLSLADDRPLAAFYRQAFRRRIELLPATTVGRANTAEELVRDSGGWTVVPAAHFMGREGQVVASPWLFHGDENDPYSVVAFRRREPDEKPTPFLYRQRWNTSNDWLWQELLIKTFSADSVRLTIGNTAGAVLNYTWVTPLARGTGVLPADGQTELAVPVPQNAVVEVRLGFEASGALAQTNPVVTLHR